MFLKEDESDNDEDLEDELLEMYNHMVVIQNAMIEALKDQVNSLTKSLTVGELQAESRVGGHVPQMMTSPPTPLRVETCETSKPS